MRAQRPDGDPVSGPLSGGHRLWTRLTRSPGTAALAAGMVAVLVYLNSLGNGFALDDVPIVLDNDAIHDIAELPDALGDSYWGGESGSRSGIWRPVTTGLLGIEWAMWGDDAAPYHAVNVLLHGVATALGTLVLAELVPVGAALVGGLIFAVHPVHVEAVSNIVGVAELLAAGLLFGACLLFFRLREMETWSDGSERSRRRKMITVFILLLYGLAFLTKESAAVLPAVFMLIDSWKDRLEVRGLRGYLARRGVLYGGMVLVAAGVLWARFQVLGSIAATVPPLGGDLLRDVPRIWTLPVIWLHYLRLLVLPADLSPDYTPGVIEIQLGWSLPNLLGVAAVIALFLLTWAVWRDEKTPHVVPFGVLWFVITVLPVANVVFLSEIFLAERTLYTPTLGFVAIAGTVAWEVGRGSLRITVSSVAVVLVLMTVRTWTATPIWRSTGTVMNYLLAEHPESGRVQWMWADLMVDEGEDPTVGLAAYRRALSETGGTYAIADDVVQDLLRLGKNEQAARISRLMWRDRPDDPRAPARLAIALSNLGRPEELVEPAEAALASSPENSVLHHLVAMGYRERAEWDRALFHRRRAIELGEGGRWQQWEWLAELQRRVGDSAGAVASLDSARVRTVDPTVRRRLDSLLESGSFGGEPEDEMRK